MKNAPIVAQPDNTFNTPPKNSVAQAVEVTLAVKSGKLFAQSEVNAAESFNLFAQAVGTEPTYEVWETERLAWVNGFVEVKPAAKGDAAYKAFGRFKTRLVDTYAIPVPKATSKAATKKAEERAAKKAEVLKRYEAKSDDELHQLVSRAYERQAKNPLASDAIIKELKTVLKERTKEQASEAKADLRAKRDEVIKAVRGCEDMGRLDMALEVLSPDNEMQVEYLA